MAVSAMEMTLTSERVIDLRGHRLGELVQALTGCSTESAELAVGDLSPTGQVEASDALDVVATALVRVRRNRRALERRLTQAS